MASVVAILGCSRSTARSLLVHFRWNTETLFGARRCRALLAALP